MNNNFVSIIIPAYNVGQFISETLESIQRQTFDNWEAIIVDDGSTDNTIEVVKNFTQNDKRFRLICQPNGGVSNARNTGLLAASGTYLSFLDGDDMWKPTFLAELLSTFQDNNINMAYCGYTHLYASGFRRKFSYPYVNGNILLPVIQGETQVHIGAILVKKEVIDKIGLLFTDGCSVGEDQEFLWKLVSVVLVQNVSKELMIYRIRTGSAITAKWNWQKHIQAFYGFERAMRYILSQPSNDCDKEYLSKVLHRRVAYKLFKIVWRMIKNGYVVEAMHLMDNREYSIYLNSLDPTHLRLMDKLKYQITFTRSKRWWKLAQLL
ncbi:glycosyl transferase family 2 [Anaerospora hongkongensis]|uniref:Glycosyl transferase family 2 n=1 Tax=Anaerospora hongkongensis TaxID=244830 RepID=A0A4R1PV76_9FIRM|nr:glycosyltransferase family A protein [Anaerospora hongkongensis]TCL36080.1 glycosyl transferase family 2 [Anaerospora hongkongensis]